MAEVNNRANKIIVAGVGDIVVNSKCSHHSIAIEADDANTFTIKSKIQGLTALMSFESNTIDNNSSAAFILPGTESFEITPSDLTKPYIIQVHSF
jgi:hypothetical protein